MIGSTTLPSPEDIRQFFKGGPKETGPEKEEMHKYCSLLTNTPVKMKEGMLMLGIMTVIIK